MNENYSTLCPCHSQKLYKDCCKIYHDGSLPSSAEQLMRSRYSAYALNIPKYIIETTHPSNSEYSPDTVAWTKTISIFCLDTQFVNLKIINANEKDNNATVEFIAYLIQDVGDISFKENSYFEKVNGKWLYLSGEPCPI